MFRGGPARTGEEPGPGPDGEPEELWRLETADIVFSSQTVADGVVYVPVWDGFLHAIDVESGEELRTFETGGMDSVPTVVDGVVYVGSYEDFTQGSEPSVSAIHAIGGSD